MGHFISLIDGVIPTLKCNILPLPNRDVNIWYLFEFIRFALDWGGVVWVIFSDEPVFAPTSD